MVANGDEAAQQATEHLIKTGSRRVAFLGGPNHLDMVKRRKHGYLEALKANKIPIDRDIIVCGKINFALAQQQTIRLLKKENRPDAILAFNDIITYAAFTAVKSLGLRIPEDVAIIGFTDTEASEYVTPKLSTIEDQSHKTGTLACELLMRVIKGDTKRYHEVVPMKLMIRESSAKIKDSKQS